MEPRATTDDSRVLGVVDPRISLALWLRDGRARRKLSLDDVARVTKIQPRILEKLEAAQLDGLPADVFVRGFVRSFARCVGLDEHEALAKYGACVGIAPPLARALVATMSDLAPVTARQLEAPIAVEDRVVADVIADAVPEAVPDPVVAAETIAVSDAPAPAKKKRAPRKKSTSSATPRTRKKKPTDAPKLEDGDAVAPLAGSSAELVADDIAAVAPPEISDAAPSSTEPAIAVVDLSVDSPAELSAACETWQPTMPPIAPTPSVPWRRPAFATSTYVSPSLVIDDADPESAELERDQRDAEKAHRVSFLPPILLDREDKSGRQGGLTLAVIILLIAATITLSYLMRRPSVSGDGVTMRAMSAPLRLV